MQYKSATPVQIHKDLPQGTKKTIGAAANSVIAGETYFQYL